MTTSQLRLAQTHLQYRKHERNLTNFIEDTTRFNRLDPVDQHLILDQRDQLRALIGTIELRMSRLNIPV